MKTNKKKIIVLISLVVLLVATGVLNYFLNLNNAPKDDDDIVAPTFFASYREDRETTRAEEILYLDSIITSAEADEETIAQAQQKKLALCDIMETELILEGLIKAKGFEDCVVTISTENVNVVVKKEELTQEQAAQILHIIVSETDFESPNVILIPYA
ncbi:MAG: SpoIIIAH-like family protein [Clostridia bacterium]|nr:SpoIIIAH-like family protein [Clostridiales bacterium]